MHIRIATHIGGTIISVFWRRVKTEHCKLTHKGNTKKERVQYTAKITKNVIVPL